MATKTSSGKKRQPDRRTKLPSAELASGKSSTRRKAAAGRFLVIVESPAKAKTINKYLGGGYTVKASMGHVRDLPEHGLAVDIENAFAPTYAVVPGRAKILSDLRKLADQAPTVYLATDLDREGEAIAWHLVQALDIPEGKVRRVVFNEITRGAIQDAFAHPRQIDMDKVNAQQARRILDRIVGYELSPLLWKKVAKGLSAGRVQSVAVRMIVDREKEIRDFVPSEYWGITAVFATAREKAEHLAPEWEKFLAGGGDPDAGRTQKETTAWLAEHNAIQAELVALAGRPFKPSGRYDASQGPEAAFASAADEARRVAEALGFIIEDREEKVWQEYAHLGLRTVDLVGAVDRQRVPGLRVADVQTRRARAKAGPPFTTATLQQAASSQLGLSPSRTMQLAQQLYEGVELHGESGPVGLITYMRTDSTNLSRESLEAVRAWIGAQCGERYLPEVPNAYGAAKRAQEAHEAIRPTEIIRTPESLKGQLSGGLYKLYDLIWRRFVACQMTPAEWNSTTVSIKAQTPLGEAEFRATGRTLAFDGFYRVAGMPKSNGEQMLPALTAGQEVVPIDIEPEQHFTSPPPRYTEASLVKRLEAEGVGRPSTYAAIIQTVQERGYAEQVDRRLYATDRGTIVTEKLVEHFPDVMAIQFTSFMEDELDKIEDAHLDWVRVLHKFYDPFHRDLVRAHDEMEAARTEPSEYKCDRCGSEMVYRWSRTGRFLSCARFPDCKGALNVDREGRPIRQPEITTPCEVCGKPMVLRQSRHGPFLGCSGYPDCTSTVACTPAGEPLKLVTDEELQQPCPTCGEGVMQVKRRGTRTFLGCTRYPECRQTLPVPQGVRLERKSAPVEEAGFSCERCGRPMRIKTGRRGQFIACSGFPRCRNAKPIEKLEELRAEAAARPLPAPPAAQESGATADRRSRSGAKSAGKGGGSGRRQAEPGELGSPPPGFAWTRTGRLVIETWPAGVLHCPQCGGELLLKAGRFGPFFSCSNYPKCKCSVNLRGAAKKQAEVEMPTTPKPKPVPTDIPCEECGAPTVIRVGRSGKFLGCSRYPKCKLARPLPPELVRVPAAAR